ncbi:hypothetical protein RIF29_16994 [Crotalaria pallida]|uniref:Uncharacterized protein n=1 Tax=Crotalaria pallida TaxID=3830 RepID=A0AAN9FPQ0_CROPI
MPRRKRNYSSASHGASTVPSLSESVSQPEYDNIQDLEADLEAEMDEFSSSAKNKTIRHFWTVNVIDDEGVVREQHLKVKELFAMNDGRRVITEWNRENQPIGESGGLLGDTS